MTQEFHISVTPIRGDEYLVRTERVAPGVPLAEEQVTWPVEAWLSRAVSLMNDPLLGLLRGDPLHPLTDPFMATGATNPSLGQASADFIAFGQELYNALFQGTIRDSWMTAQGIAQHRQEVLRLRLGLKDNRLPRLPWEVLHAGDRPLATGTDIVFCRYHSSFAAIASPLQLRRALVPDPVLRILMVLSAPSDQEILKLKQEALHLQDELQTAFRSGSKGNRFSDIQLTILEQPGREQLTQTLEHNYYQVLHYAGHSNLGTAGGKLYLVSSKTGLTETLSGDDLAGLLVNNGIRLAVFNSCRGGYTADLMGEAGEGNLAEALVKRGIPAVLAMAERIPDDVALHLSRLFYRSLKQAYAIDLSLNRARQGLISSYGSDQLYWALPILYLHPEFDGFLQPAAETTNGNHSPLWENPLDAALPTVPMNGNGRSRDHGNLGDFDRAILASEDLELDDPDYQSDLETVAKLVSQLSQPSTPLAGDRPAQATSTEKPFSQPKTEPDLEGNRVLSEPPKLGAMPLNAFPVSDQLAAPIPASQHKTFDVYAELEDMLADAGKLTEAIATCSDAVRANPNDAEAYHHLGLALYEQGYLAEAITAYQQAVHLNPTLAAVQHHLGLAFYHQGNFSEATHAFRIALQLDPNLSEARQHLTIVRQRQGIAIDDPAMPKGRSPSKLAPGQPVGATSVPDPWDDPLSLNSEFTPEQPFAANATGDRPTAPHRPHRKPWLWLGAGSVVGMTALVVGMWAFQQQQPNRSTITIPLPDQALSTSVEKPSDLQKLSTPVVVTMASEQLNQNNMPAASRAIDALLNRGALKEAAAVMVPVLNREAENPTINFLMGRLTWQYVLAGNKDYSISDARRYWEKAEKLQSSALHQNAVGFTYYEEGKIDLASKAWRKALELAGEQKSDAAAPPSTAPASPDALTAYAGIALTLQKAVDQAPPDKRTEQVNGVIKLRQKIMSDDPTNFQPDALGNNWLWSEKAVRDWRSLQRLK